MKRIRDGAFRVLVAVVAIALLLFPYWLMVPALTAIDFMVALGAVLASVIIAIWLPRWKWIGAVVASLLIAVLT